MTDGTARVEKCRCIHFDADLDENEDGVVCTCGHVIEEHRPDDPKYPGDRSCKGVYAGE